MRILFWSGKLGYYGPANITKQYLRNLNGSFVTVKSTHKYGEFLEAVWKLASSDVVVVSGISRKGTLLVSMARFLRRKSVYIMHGCASYEAVLNEVECTKEGLRREKQLLKYATLILPVSKKFMNWVKEYFPQYAHKTKYLFNGIDKDLLPRSGQYAGHREGIIAAGGDTKLKGNTMLTEAVEGMAENVQLTICGELRNSCQPDSKRVKYTGQLPHDQFVDKLSRAKLFVLNSVHESFSIAAVEALMCGCSVLLSEKAGVTDILELEECDIIHDPMDREEIRRKILYLLEHPNNQRIMEKLDLDEYSYPKQVARLEAMCRELVNS